MERSKDDRPDGLALSEEDTRLWRELTRAVRPLAGRAALPLGRSLPIPPQAASPVMPDARAHPARQPAATPAPVPLSEAARAATPGLDRRSAQRLRRGLLPIEARIDLHGMTQSEAHRMLNAFLRASHAAGRRVVLVITGRGINPGARRPEEATGVLRRAVPRWLHEGDNARLVITYAAAQPRDGGHGALYVMLRRRRA